MGYNPRNFPDFQPNHYIFQALSMLSGVLIRFRGDILSETEGFGFKRILRFKQEPDYWWVLLEYHPILLFDLASYM